MLKQNLQRQVIWWAVHCRMLVRATHSTQMAAWGSLFWDAVSVSRSRAVTWLTLQENKGKKNPLGSGEGIPSTDSNIQVKRYWEFSIWATKPKRLISLWLNGIGSILKYTKWKSIKRGITLPREKMTPLGKKLISSMRIAMGRTDLGQTNLKKIN